jgi:hypothetical protein
VGVTTLAFFPQPQRKKQRAIAQHLRIYTLT